MEKYTATYTGIKNCFVIQNIDGPDYVDQYYSLLCVTKNILMRGRVSRPSQYLLSELGELSHTEQNDKPVMLLSQEMPKWNQRIKGSRETNDYPAEDFFINIIPEFLPEHKFVQGLLLPEARIEDITPNTPNNFKNQQVDFFLPQANLVIEIDGEQHKEKTQFYKDIERDSYLKKNGIEVLRITASSIRNRDEELITSIETFKELLIQNQIIKEYALIYRDHNYYESFTHHLIYDVVMRFQILLVTMLQKNVISFSDPEWEFCLISKFPDAHKLLHIAFEDVVLWFDHLCRLSKLEFCKPTIKINKKKMKTPIKVDMDIFKRWTDENLSNPDTIYIRNDYFDNKDYFQVSTSESIRYRVEMNETYSDEPNLKFFLKNLFEYDDFNDGQLPIIAHALNLNDTIGILPTGSGKSLCYQFCCLLQPTVNFVVSPILSLIYDQKENLDEFGITRTAYITSDQTGEEKGGIITHFGKGSYLLVWISPERFQTNDFRKALQEINIKLNFSYAVIDEVHCLSEWGHDFRTSYLNLAKTIRRYCPQATFLGLTATASQFVLEDLKREFEINAESIKSVSSMSRKELTFHVLKSDRSAKYNILLQLLKCFKEKNGEVFELKGDQSICGLIFTVTANGKRGCKSLAYLLSSDLKIAVEAYYAGLDHDFGKGKKKAVQDGFKQNRTALMVATKAFGMGVNKKNICYTIHYGLPWSIEAFYQEAGRAGRAGQASDCYILYSPEQCEKEVIEQIFALNTTMEQLEQLREKLASDLSSLMFLWQQNNDGIDADLGMMRWVMNYLHKKSTTTIACDKNHKKSAVEKAIYRLTLLGFLNDWTVVSWGEDTGRFEVMFNDYSLESIRDTFTDYIRRYDPVFSLDNNADRYQTYQNIINDNTLKPYVRYMKALLQWSYDNIVYSRRQSINNIRVLCESNMDSDQIKLYVDQYFKFSETTIFLDNIVAKPNDYSTWFDILYTKNTKEDFHIVFDAITKEKAEEILISLQRYLESYRYNTGLNFVYGFLRIKCNQFYGSDAPDRLNDAFNTIDGFDVQKQEQIFAKCLEFGSTMEDESRIILGEYLANRYPDMAKRIYMELQDYGSLSVALSGMAERVNAIKEKFIW